MSNNLQSNFLLAAVSLILGAILLASVPSQVPTFQYYTGGGTFSPRLFPTVVLSLTVVVSVAHMLTNFKALKKDGQLGLRLSVNLGRIKYFIFSVVGFSLILLLTPFFGLTISGAIILFSLLILFQFRPWYLAFILSLILPWGVDFVYRSYFGIFMPKGMFF